MDRQTLVSKVLGGCVVLVLATGTTALSGEQAFESGSALGRFQVLSDYGGEAVLDTETGLIWEQAPPSSEAIWYRAKSDCGVKVIGGRRGWRLPSFFELMTLVDPTMPRRMGTPLLPTGHPFGHVQARVYWSSDTPEQDPVSAYVVDFAAGDVSMRAKTRHSGLWCVKGSHAQPVVPLQPLHVIRWMRPS